MAEQVPNVPPAPPREASQEERERRAKNYEEKNRILKARGGWPMMPEYDEVITWIPAYRFPGFENLPDFDMRNGDESDARPMLVRPTIPPAFHWVPVAGVEPVETIAVVDAHIMSAMHQMAANPAPVGSEALARKRAIVLGVSRAVVTKHYRLGANDFIAGEAVPPVIHVEKDTTVLDGTTYRYTATTATNDPHRHLLTTPLVFTDVEKAVISTLLLSSLGTPALQGYSLMMCGHHYLSDAGSISRRVCGVVEKQFWNSNAVKAWFADDIDDLQDMAWHKSCHPINLALKEEFACTPKIATMLKEAGAGSAASRLPAQETELRCAGSYIALLATVHPLFKLFGGGVDYKIITDLVGDIKAVAREGDLDEVPAYWPLRVKSRKDALNWLGELNNRFSGTVAYCFGFYVALAEASQTLSGAGSPDTLRTSFSLNKLKNQSAAAYVEGTEAYKDYAAARNKRRMEGTYVAARFVLTP